MCEQKGSLARARYLDGGGDDGGDDKRAKSS